MSGQSFSRRRFLQLSATPWGSLLGAQMAGKNPTAAHPPREGADIIRAPLAPISVRASQEGVELTSAASLPLRACRPYLAWRLPGEAQWQESSPARILDLQQTPESIFFRSRFQFLQADVRLESHRDQAWELAGTLKNTGNISVELARFHYLQGTISSQLGLLQLEGSDFPQFFRRGDSVPAFRSQTEEMWRKYKVFYSLLSEPIHDRPNWAVSEDIAVFAEDWMKPGWGCGFVGPGTAFGEIGFHTQADPPEFFIGILLDNILLEPGESRELEKAFVWCGDWQTGLDLWARVCAAEFHAQRSKPPLVGFLSWYQFGDHVTADDMLQANQEFLPWPIPPGGRTIQIDDGFEIKPGDWRPNERFAKSWADLPAAISRSGSTPGLWLAPTAVHESHPIVRDHPDWLEHLPNGEFAVYFSNWGGKTYFLEIDRPEAKDFMRDILKDVVAQGWRYLKLDFTYGLVTARKAYDRKKTSFQSLRDLYALFREACGPDVLISACIGEPGRYALGLADIARLGGDTAAEWSTVHGNMRRLLTLGSTNGAWWQGDADVFYMRTNTKLTEEESYLLTGTIGLFGGVFLTSDIPSQWSPQARAVVRQFWNSRGPRIPSSHRVLWSPAGEILAYRVSFEDGRVPPHQVGLYNCSDAAQDTRVPLSELGLVMGGDWQLLAGSQDRGIEFVNETLVVEQQPPHSLRIAGLSRSRD